MASEYKSQARYYMATLSDGFAQFFPDLRRFIVMAKGKLGLGGLVLVPLPTVIDPAPFPAVIVLFPLPNTIVSAPSPAVIMLFALPTVMLSLLPGATMPTMILTAVPAPAASVTVSTPFPSVMLSATAVKAVPVRLTLKALLSVPPAIVIPVVREAVSQTATAPARVRGVRLRLSRCQRPA